MMSGNIIVIHLLLRFPKMIPVVAVCGAGAVGAAILNDPPPVVQQQVVKTVPVKVDTGPILAQRN